MNESKLATSPRINERGFRSKYDHWTDSVRLNMKFASGLQKAQPFLVTNRAAYAYYQANHAKRVRPITLPSGREVLLGIDFMQMNVRNQLCKMEHEGILKRQRPGVYTWLRWDE